MSGDNRPGAVEDLTALYRETVLRHATHPCGYGQAIDATHECEKYNPLCGDRIKVRFAVRSGRIEATAFTGEACAICMASASMLCEQLAGQPVESACKGHRWLEAELAEEGAGGDADHDALKPLLGVRRYPSRIRCALLAWEAGCEALASDSVERGRS